MKQINFLIGILAVMAMTSCSSVKNGDFAQRKYLKKSPHIKTDRDFNDINTAVSYASNDSKPASIEQNLPLVELNTAALPKTTLDEGDITSRKDKGEKGKAKQKITSSNADVLALPLPVIEKPIMHFKKHDHRKPAQQKVVSDILLIILAIFIPPLAVFLVDGLGTSFWIDLILTLLFWLPGMIYALYIVLTK